MSQREEKTLPEDLEAERSLLATLCGYGSPESGEVVYSLQEDDFVQPVCRAIFAALRSLSRDGKEINALTLRDEVAVQGQHKSVHLQTIVDVLAANEVSRPQILAEILQRKRRSRELIRATAAALTRAEEEENPDSLAAELATELTRISTAGANLEEGPWSSILDRISEGKPFRANKAARQGWWGIPELDDIAWIPAGETTLIGGRPACGKTLLGIQIAIESAKRGFTPCFVSLELQRPAVEARIAAYLSGGTVREFRAGNYTPDQTQDVWAHKQILDKGQLACPIQGTPWHKIAAYLRKQVARGVDLVVLDYFSLIGRPTIRANSSEAYAYAALSEGINGFAKEHGIGMVVLAQLTKDSGAGEPKLNDFADSDRAARDANIALLLWKTAQGETMGKIAKNRDGKAGWVKPLELSRGVRFLALKRETNSTQEVREAWERSR